MKGNLMNRISTIFAVALLTIAVTPILAQQTAARSSAKNAKASVQDKETSALNGTWVVKVKDLDRQIVQMMQEADPDIAPGTTISYRLNVNKNGMLKGNVKIGKEYNYEIKNATFKDGKVAFSIEGDFAGENFESKYEGKVSGDKIVGKASLTADYETVEFEWKPAKRAAGARLNGVWTLQAKELSDELIQMMQQADPEIESETKFTYTLKLEKGKVKGQFKIGENYSYEISEGTFKRGKVAFSVKGEFAGESFESKYQGQIKGNKIEGKATVTADYETTEFDWNPTRR
jgi:hypothetical protein